MSAANEIRNAAVTGAGGSIIRAIALALLEEGMLVWLIGRDRDKLERVAKQGHGRARLIIADLSANCPTFCQANPPGERTRSPGRPCGRGAAGGAVDEASRSPAERRYHPAAAQTPSVGAWRPRRSGWPALMTGAGERAAATGQSLWTWSGERWLTSGGSLGGFYRRMAQGAPRGRAR
jgi:hypothetical protein